MVPPEPDGAPDLSLPLGPSDEAWRALSPRGREAFLVGAIDALQEEVMLAPEGQQHATARSRFADQLGLHFRTIGRPIYLAADLPVTYPNERVFCPDVFAVLDFEKPADDQRLGWVVTEEGRGLDFVLEVLHHGNRHKDLVLNVQRYARLSIPEYFVYDRARLQVLGYRLGAGKKYERIVPQGGRVRSLQLGIDFSVQGGALRVFHGMAELIGTDDLVRRLTGMVDEIEQRANEETARANEEAARANEEAARANEEAARANEEAARAKEAMARATAALGQMRAALFATLERNGLHATPDERARIEAEEDVAVIGAWLARALSATRVDAVFDGP